jgi:hypothetical protein
LITDPPVQSGQSVNTDANAGSGGGMADIVPAATVISGGYALAGGTAGDTDSGTDRGVFFSGGGMVQLDALLSQFAGVISGFDPGSEVDLRSLGFGSSSGAALWMSHPSGTNGSAGVEGGGNIFNLTLLGQYAAANFDAGADGHGGALITVPPASSSLVPTPLVAHQ